jgi:hypothetical protein
VYTGRGGYLKWTFEFYMALGKKGRLKERGPPGLMKVTKKEHMRKLRTDKSVSSLWAIENLLE